MISSVYAEMYTECQFRQLKTLYPIFDAWIVLCNFSTRDFSDIGPNINQCDCWATDVYKLYNVILLSSSLRHVVHVINKLYRPIYTYRIYIKWFSENFVSIINQSFQIRQRETGVLHSQSDIREESKLHSEYAHSIV